MLTNRQKEILAFLINSHEAVGVMPSTREVQQHFGFASQTAAVDVIRALEKKGCLKRLPGKARGIVLAGCLPAAPGPAALCLPLYGTIAAGYAGVSSALPGDSIRVDRAICGLQSADGCYALKVEGDSMSGAHIMEGDYVILDAKRKPRHHDVVAARLDGRMTLKRLVIEADRLWLKAENPAFPRRIPVQASMLQGVMRGLIRGAGSPGLMPD